MRHGGARAICIIAHPHPHLTLAALSRGSTLIRLPMAFTLHGSSNFTCTRRVALIAKERNVPYKLITVDVSGGEHKQPAYLKHQPFGQVPYITVRRFSAFTSVRGCLMPVRICRIL